MPRFAGLVIEASIGAGRFAHPNEDWLQRDDPAKAEDRIHRDFDHNVRPIKSPDDGHDGQAENHHPGENCQRSNEFACA